MSRSSIEVTSGRNAAQAKSAVHFGAGSLGRGLVVPLLTESGCSVTLVDVDRELVRQLAHRGGYALETVTDRQSRHREIPVVAAIEAGDASAVRSALSGADVVTTAVRIENLVHVARVMNEAGSPNDDQPTVIACENAVRASTLLASMADRFRGRYRDTTVDRICQSAWPHDLTVRAEAYREWSVEAEPTDDLPSAAETVTDLMPRFDRKRFLVNTTADALAFIGASRGLRFLHEAARDPATLRTCEPAFGELRRLLVLMYGFSPRDVEAYHQAAIGRLAEPRLARPLDTVGRSADRKLGSDERFAGPALALLERNIQAHGLAQVIKRIAATSAIAPGSLRTEWASHRCGPRLAGLVFDGAPAGKDEA